MPLAKLSPKGVPGARGQKEYSKGNRGQAKKALSVKKRTATRIRLLNLKRYQKNHQRVDSFDSALSGFPLDKYLFSKETKRLLKSGKPVVLIVEGLEPGEMLKVYPDNSKEIIRLDENFNEVVVRKV